MSRIVEKLRKYSNPDGEMDYDMFSERIKEVTGRDIDPNDLKKVKVEDWKNISVEFLDTLSIYANETGFPDEEVYRRPFDTVKLALIGDCDPMDYKYNKDGRAIGRTEDSGLVNKTK